MILTCNLCNTGASFYINQLSYEGTNGTAGHFSGSIIDLCDTGALLYNQLSYETTNGTGHFSGSINATVSCTKARILKQNSGFS